MAKLQRTDPKESQMEPNDQGTADLGANGEKMDDSVLVARLGAILKERRAGRFTIEALAARAGVSAGLISQIERGIGNPSFATLVRLSYALGFPLSEMFEGPQLDERQMVVRRAERQHLEVPGDGTIHEILVASRNHKLGLMASTYPPHHESESTNSHPGEEIVLVLSGTLHAEIGGQRFELGEDDTLIFDSALSHRWANPTSKPTKVLHVSTPPASGFGL